MGAFCPPNLRISKFFWFTIIKRAKKHCKCRLSSSSDDEIQFSSAHPQLTVLPIPPRTGKTIENSHKMQIWQLIIIIDQLVFTHHIKQNSFDTIQGQETSFVFLWLSIYYIVEQCPIHTYLYIHKHGLLSLLLFVATFSGWPSWNSCFMAATKIIDKHFSAWSEKFFFAIRIQLWMPCEEYFIWIFDSRYCRLEFPTWNCVWDSFQNEFFRSFEVQGSSCR